MIDVLLPQPIDFTCVETQIGNGDPLDCEIIEFDGQEGYHKVQVPTATARTIGAQRYRACSPKITIGFPANVIVIASMSQSGGHALQADNAASVQCAHPSVSAKPD